MMCICCDKKISLLYPEIDLPDGKLEEDVVFNTKEKIQIELKPGSLIIMKGALQHNWLHQIPSQLKIKEPRINLTFRTIKN